jgi:hypothetical protein
LIRVVDECEGVAPLREWIAGALHVEVYLALNA